MAKKQPAKAATPAAIDPEVTYEVKIKRKVAHGRTILRPTDARIRMLGATIIELGDAVDVYREV
jgi:hypothetical protein